MNPWWHRPSPTESSASPSQKPTESSAEEPAFKRQRRRRGRSKAPTEKPTSQAASSARQSGPSKRRRRGRRKSKAERPIAVLCDPRYLTTLSEGQEGLEPAGILEKVVQAVHRGKASIVARCYGQPEAEMPEVEGVELEVVETDEQSAAMTMAMDSVELVVGRRPVGSVVLLSDLPETAAIAARLRERVDVVVIGSPDHAAAEVCTRVLTVQELDDLATERAKQPEREQAPASEPDESVEAASAEEAAPAEPLSVDDALGRLVQTIHELVNTGDGVLWSSRIRQQLLRSLPSFDEASLGYDSFSAFLQEAERRQLIELGHDERTESHYVAAVARLE